MAKDPRGFLKVKRDKTEYRPVCQRVKDYDLVFDLRSDEKTIDQAVRCMDCGTPFCHWGCPLGNLIPEWNELMARGLWAKAATMLNATNNLPEVTGRICPALCEYSCVLGINDDPITIRENELGIIEHAFREGMIAANPPCERTGKKVAVVGSGPAGLSCAAQLNQAGHIVTVFEKDERIGGIMRFGIPDFKLEKKVLDRRLAIWEREGINFKTGVNVGVDLPAEKLLKEFDAVVLCGGSRQPRDLKVEGRELKGIYFAMEYLTQSNRRVAGEMIPADRLIDAKGKKVVVIGGGDTGSDCVGTANRQGAACVVQIELMSKQPECRTGFQPWPKFPLLLKTTTSHEEGAQRQWQIATKKFGGEEGRVKKLICARVDFSKKDKNNCAIMQEVSGSDFEIEADLVFLALGFVQPERIGLLESLKVAFDQRGNVKTDDKYQTSVRGVFSAGDMRRGQSLIVWAISEGRKAARAVDEYLFGFSSLPVM
ncbi:glutamate synthase [candidate division WOR-1 bacterium RIFOXYA12_FULL_52_29]|uniref:Glutamate synthase n=1 Tax=candidate division WOR-1 bacterium RIFOXYC12_FULL_54_18 TaxID=1802584 RepID=A0A1F4T7I8_UNCSA|nr:MAG: glutamate synthase [candidate division WOR-1 bacterium RIFOXYA2_FULL_51_19]OGC18268.1 MAG: glutamate synthase [candidate division WOR-1 bacterium RIFOXYA12_FULL_52_29]OGC27123.1 MAG: glutamate synthase [candidate division WOR-1 bacterium RIFOXYB2_FULL_45_9]OGC28685.1 MAG: glutamate synthase [candidate division WOR-1 bacterium RIFOXYC12_FULL_54_18]OGC30860.1 MAG: glutamate synthase [candidate division WOR-1 bacterium RIFOXYB12_FULL_52_16]